MRVQEHTGWVVVIMLAPIAVPATSFAGVAGALCKTPGTAASAGTESRALIKALKPVTSGRLSRAQLAAQETAPPARVSQARPRR